MNIKLELTVDAVNFILNVLGELPSKTGAFSLILEIKNQAEAQIPKEPQDGLPSSI
jgi:hypothetical protein